MNRVKAKLCGDPVDLQAWFRCRGLRSFSELERSVKRWNPIGIDDEFYRAGLAWDAADESSLLQAVARLMTGSGGMLQRKK